VDKAKNRLPRPGSLRDRKTIFRLIVKSHCSTKLANLAKINPVDAEIIGLKGIVEIRNSSRTYSP